MKRVKITSVNASENREAWLDLRRQHLTATDWPKVTGTSRWGNAADVIADKQDNACHYQNEPSLPMRVGTDLEPFIVENMKRKLGPGDYLSQTFISRRYMGFTPDLIRVSKGSDWDLAEIKVSVKAWNGAVPHDYLDQVKFQATVLGLEQVHVVHLQLQNWQQGLSLIKAGAVPTRLLTTYLVRVSDSERREIERQAKKWWNTYVLR